MAEEQPTESNARPPIYEESSQYRHWRFSPEQLWNIRKTSHETAVERVKQNIQEDLKESEEATSENQDPQYLSIEEELALCRFYEKQLQSICRHFKFTDAVMATAMVYMKRFFLYNSIMDYHPKDILLTCLFLSTKSESERISIDQFGKNLNLPSTDSILGLEFVVSQGIRFEYLVHHPYRAAYGLFLELQRGDVDIKVLKETYNKVQGLIGSMLLTDLSFIYQPSQLALGAFVIAGRSTGFDQHILRHMETKVGKEKIEMLSKIADDVAETIDQFVAVSPNEAKLIDRRLRVCMNPAKNPDSALYKKRAAEKEREDEERDKKRARQGTDDEDEDLSD
ncbi:hypothetical protein O0I10_000005 [Lichtheimia ornata]|uniref:Cyclin-like domain-containing protein n=1 Tax=Lichtheimia ornata TaxID=688661 RepID=A0AAD7Y4Q8_9FUNG|nr:uncharacterized protein O0I10_000005 [Lichtheimia ornata]KAJ8663732.1 hypothetical protein O0I10_000005 [Lichtheimia ornata]